jgi:hypothetical protein
MHPILILYIVILVLATATNFVCTIETDQSLDAFFRRESLIVLWPLWIVIRLFIGLGQAIK